ncbi:unnamed protein product, partial [Heterosigma akashiwo]
GRRPLLPVRLGVLGSRHALHDDHLPRVHRPAVQQVRGAARGLPPGRHRGPGRAG